MTPPRRARGVVTSLKEENENSASQIFSNDRDCLAPHVHSRRAKGSDAFRIPSDHARLPRRDPSRAAHAEGAPPKPAAAASAHEWLRCRHLINRDASSAPQLKNRLDFCRKGRIVM